MGQVFFADEAAQAATIERSIRPQAVALWLFALVLTVTALLIVGPAMAALAGRQARRIMPCCWRWG